MRVRGGWLGLVGFRRGLGFGAIAQVQASLTRSTIVREKTAGIAFIVKLMKRLLVSFGVPLPFLTASRASAQVFLLYAFAVAHQVVVGGLASCSFDVAAALSP